MRWSGHEARSMTAQGVEGGQAGEMVWATVGEDGDDDELADGGEGGDELSGRCIIDAISDERRWSAMRNTTVCVGTYGGGGGATPLRPVPVQISTWSATLRCVGGIWANRGAESALVTPGSTIGGNPLSLK